MIFWTVMYTEIYLLTKSIWPIVLMHTTEDALVNPHIFEGYIQVAQGKEFLVSPTAGIITTFLYLIVGLLLRKKTTNEKNFAINFNNYYGSLKRVMDFLRRSNVQKQGEWVAEKYNSAGLSVMYKQLLIK
ncbi:hypothetical protein AB1J28_05245 [Lysinibacillus irui]|uniref:hypothetical protein n=1 Tax=Lysinibacillus irui TaxID=2998077 RepID=UPI003D2CB2BB